MSDFTAEEKLADPIRIMDLPEFVRSRRGVVGKLSLTSCKAGKEQKEPSSPELKRFHSDHSGLRSQETSEAAFLRELVPQDPAGKNPAPKLGPQRYQTSDPRAKRSYPNSFRDGLWLNDGCDDRPV